MSSNFSLMVVQRQRAASTPVRPARGEQHSTVGSPICTFRPSTSRQVPSFRSEHVLPPEVDGGDGHPPLGGEPPVTGGKVMTGGKVTGGKVTGDLPMGGTVTGDLPTGGTLTGGFRTGGTVTGGRVIGGTVTGVLGVRVLGVGVRQEPQARVRGSAEQTASNATSTRAEPMAMARIVG